MSETPVLVVIEVTAVHDVAGLRSYVEQAARLIGPLGGRVIGQGGKPVEGDEGFALLVVQRWSSEDAFQAWLASDVYRPLNELRRASASMRAAIVPLAADA